MYHYTAYGHAIESEIQLPDLMPNELKSPNPIVIQFGKMPQHKVLNENSKHLAHNNEFFLEIPQTVKLCIKNGNNIIVEPLIEDISSTLVYIYGRGLTAALMQRKLLLLHASGVLVAPNKVVLFAAPSQTGKSSLAINLEEKGYKLFTDDTALLNISKGKCYATASYPMTRLWQNTIENQKKYTSLEKKTIPYQSEKFGFNFHDDFITQKVEVAAIVFLKAFGKKITVRELNHFECFEQLLNNVYAGHWVEQMNYQKQQFFHLTEVSNTIKPFLAYRPKNKTTFDTFTDRIEREILMKL